MIYTPSEERTPEWGWDFAFITSDSGDPEWRKNYAREQIAWLMHWFPQEGHRPN